MKGLTTKVEASSVGGVSTKYRRILFSSYEELLSAHEFTGGLDGDSVSVGSLVDMKGADGIRMGRDVFGPAADTKSWFVSPLGDGHEKIEDGQQLFSPTGFEKQSNRKFYNDLGRKRLMYEDVNDKHVAMFSQCGNIYLCEMVQFGLGAVGPSSADVGRAKDALTKGKGKGKAYLADMEIKDESDDEMEGSGDVSSLVGMTGKCVIERSIRIYW